MAVVLLLALAGNAMAKNGAYKSTLHGDRAKGPQRRLDQPRGSCVQCHDGHASHKETAPAADRKQAGLFVRNDNEFCFTCHEASSDNGIFNGAAVWSQSTHGRLDGSVTTLPGAGETPRTLQCLVCHDPHGTRDDKGVVPALARQRGAELCTQCHDGSRASDMKSQLAFSFVHGDRARGEHDSREGSDPSRFAASPQNKRHVDCSDCHNVHGAMSAAGGTTLTGVSRVEVDAGSSAGNVRYTFRSASDNGDEQEYQICFKCHSSWTKQPSQQSDLAELTLPSNPSFHPIQSEGKNRNIASEAFVPGYASDTRIACTDCHGSDDTRARGLHASRYEHLLRKPYGSAMSVQSVSADDLCFSCHSYSVYAEKGAPSSQQAASRFNQPSSAGHVFHVVAQQIPCGGCHDPHGSTQYPALLARVSGRGIISYKQTADGGTCRTSCHEERSYKVNYPR